DRIEKANKTLNALARDFNILERGIPFSSLFSKARTLVRSAEERTKPNGERLREYTDSNKPSLEQQLFSEAPIYDDLEQLLVASALSFTAEQLGMENELVQKILAGKSPQERAAELVQGSKLKDVKVRRELYEGGKPAVDASTDSMIAFAKLIDGPA